MHCVQIVCVCGGGVLRISLGWRTVGKAGVEEESEEGINGVCDDALRGACKSSMLGKCKCESKSESEGSFAQGVFTLGCSWFEMVGFGFHGKGINNVNHNHEHPLQHQRNHRVA